MKNITVTLAVSILICLSSIFNFAHGSSETEDFRDSLVRRVRGCSQTMFTRGGGQVLSQKMSLFINVHNTVNNYSPLQALYRQMLCVFFPPAFAYKIYSLKLYHLLNFTLHSKANAYSIGTCFRFYMQMPLDIQALVLDFIRKCGWKKNQSICLQSAYRGL